VSSKRKKFEAITHVSTLPQIEEDAMRDGYDILFTEVATPRAAPSSASPSLSAIACISANVKGPSCVRISASVRYTQFLCPRASRCAACSCLRSGLVARSSRASL